MPGGVQRHSSSATSELRPSGGRVPPHDLDAEAAVLSAVMLAQEAFDRVPEILRPEHFYSGANRRVYEAVLALQNESRPVDIVTVAGWLRDKGCSRRSAARRTWRSSRTRLRPSRTSRRTGASSRRSGACAAHRDLPGFRRRGLR